jgi:predicted nucleic acid-binding protein
MDANVLLEVLLDRRLAKQCSQLLTDANEELAISALTVHIIWYVAEKYKLDQSNVDEFLKVWEILPLTAANIKTARQRYDGKDFEDCLQAACAEAAQCDEIVTIDKHFRIHSHTKLKVKTLR